MPGTILLVEDDSEIARVITFNLQNLGFVVECVSDGKAGLSKALSKKYELLILDINLPSLSGLDVCRLLRKEDERLPVLILTSNAEDIDRVVGLELGADDYLTKPFNIRELSARVRALLRRAGLGPPADEPQSSPLIVAKDLVIDRERRKVTRSGTVLQLSTIEFDLLVFFAEHPGRAFTREDLVKMVWGYSASCYESTVNAQLSRLRKKIEPDPDNPIYIKTVWGFGYQFTDFLDEVAPN